LTQSVRVEVAGGLYTLTEPLVFTPEDSGTAGCPITYEAAPGAKPIFSGGRVITGFQPGEGELWVARIPEVASGEWTFEQLWVNGRRATRARSPNKFYYYTTRKVGYGTDPLTGQQVDLSRRAFSVRPEDIQPLLGKSPEQWRDVCLVAYHAWESSRHRMAALDPENQRIITTGSAPWPTMMWGGPQRYHLENFREALDSPGEWFLDRDGTLYYWPLPGETLPSPPSEGGATGGCEVVAPVLESFVHFTGQPDLGLPVEHLTLRGLTFHYSGYWLPPEGHADSQAAAGIPAVVMADGAQNVTIERCEIAHTGLYGLWFRRACQHCRVQQTHFHDLGAGGVRIGESIIAPEVERTGHIVCDNNLIHAGGRIFTGAVGVWIGQSSDNQVTHNDISDLYYTGISVGWSWGYADTDCKRNKIEFNHIHHLGWGVMSDMGAVYTLGVSDGTTVSNNVIHDIFSYDRYGWGGLGLYNDEGSTHLTMENNLVYHTKDMTYHQHYGRENVIRNNILVCGQESQISVHRVEPHLSATFENNIVYWKTGKLFWQPSLDGRQLSFDNNVYWCASGEPFDFMGLTFEEWQQAGHDTHSLIADPLFVDPDRLDFRLKPDSPALKLGFKPFDYSKAGLYGDPDWVAIPQRIEYPPVEIAPDPPPPPPFVLDEGFEDYPVGAAPLDAQVHLEGKGESIAVTDETACPPSPTSGEGRGGDGRQSLKVVDAPGLQFSFNPHFVYTPHYSEGVAHCSFDLRVEEGVEFWHEWRDWSQNPYLIGPSLQVIGNRLKFRETDLLEVPVGQWFHLDITAGLGPQSTLPDVGEGRGGATGTFEVTVTLPNQPPQRFPDLPFVSPEWKQLTWIGFVSNAQEKTVFYLDNIRIDNPIP